jgi:acetate---CoA ligase (ADP-forming)
MGSRGSAANPADLTQFGNGADFAPILQYFLDEPNHDLVIVASVGAESQARTVIAARDQTEKPLFFVWTGSARDAAGLPLLKASNVPLFYSPAKAARAAKALVNYYRLHADIRAECERGEDRLPPAPVAVAAFRRMLGEARSTALNEHASKAALADFGIRGPREILCATPDDAVEGARAIGFPVALKIASGDIPHKTEAGGVVLGVSGAEAVARAFGTMMEQVRRHHPDAHIQGVIVQEMVVGGLELIVGVSRDAHFGPVLMLGLGGVLAEAMAASAWRICPVTRREAREMIDEVRGLSKLMGGYRGARKADTDAVVDVLVNVSRLAVWAADRLVGFDINPLAVLEEGRGAVALDALILPSA